MASLTEPSGLMSLICFIFKTKKKKKKLAWALLNLKELFPTLNPCLASTSVITPVKQNTKRIVIKVQLCKKS
jgi:hypothetical protein